MEGSSEFKIEKGIPVPVKTMPLRASKYPWMDMAVGDSFLVECEPEVAKKLGNTIATSGRSFMRRRGIAGACTSSRTVEGGVRIWRTA